MGKKNKKSKAKNTPVVNPEPQKLEQCVRVQQPDNACATNSIETSQSNSIETLQSNSNETSQSNSIETSQSNNIVTLQSNSIATMQSNSIATLQSNSNETSQSNSIETSQSNNIVTLQSNSIATMQSNSIATLQSNEVHKTMYRCERINLTGQANDSGLLKLIMYFRGNTRDVGTMTDDDLEYNEGALTADLQNGGDILSNE